MKTKGTLLQTLTTGVGLLALLASQSASSVTVGVALNNFTDPTYEQWGLIAQKDSPDNGFFRAEWYPEADNVWTSTVANADVGANSSAAVQAWIENDLNGIGLVEKYTDDSLGGGLNGAWTFDEGVNWISLHYDNKETVWYFDSAITDFGMQFVVGEQGLSNIRAYSGDYGGGGPSVIPIPAAAPLFGSAMGLIGWLGWRRKKQTVAALSA